MNSISPQRHGSDQTKMMYELLSFFLLMQDVGIFIDMVCPMVGLRKRWWHAEQTARVEEMMHVGKLYQKQIESSMQERIPSTEACGVIENLGSVTYSSA